MDHSWFSGFCREPRHLRKQKGLRFVASCEVVFLVQGGTMVWGGYLCWLVGLLEGLVARELLGLSKRVSGLGKLRVRRCRCLRKGHTLNVWGVTYGVFRRCSGRSQLYACMHCLLLGCREHLQLPRACFASSILARALGPTGAD